VFNLAVGEMTVLGGYLPYAFSVQLGIPIWAAVALSVVAAAIVGIKVTGCLFSPLLVNQ
jgi:branched-chain amino acid transport system permease protein